jgi:pimeloyl-ACP methyl ester carboxylesterase
MTDSIAGQVDYDEAGTGPTIVLVPGSCSTGAAWRPVTAGWQGRYRYVTTSLLGYGGTAERRTAADPAIAHEASAVEAVIRHAGVPCHLVGHSFGALVSLAVALRGQVPLRSLTVIEAPAVGLLRDRAEALHDATFRDMTTAYFAAFHGGDAAAIGTMIDFYGGAGTFAAWPAKVRAYAIQTTPVNILDWASAYGFALNREILAGVAIPVQVVIGGASPPAVRRANLLLAEATGGTPPAMVDGAAHFLIASHAAQVAAIVAAFVDAVDSDPR